MINEPWFVPRHVGWIEVVFGGMFSGETEFYEPRTRHCFRPPSDKKSGQHTKPDDTNRDSESENHKEKK